MWDSLRKRETGVRILLGVIIGVIAVGMLLYLVPQGTSTGSAPDSVAQVGGEQISLTEVRRQLQLIQRNGQIPAALAPLYAQQIVESLVQQRILELEGKRLGIRVSEDEIVERIRLILPTAFIGGNVVGMDQYAAEVEQRTGLTVKEFEDAIRRSLLEEKFRRLVTAGVSVGPEEVEQEFRRSNEKVKLEYVVIKPDDLQAKINASDAELTAYFEKNKSHYQVPERRVVRYAMLSLDQLRNRVTVSPEELRAYYNDHLDRYRIQNRVRVSHILFKTIGKTDAEVAEIRKKAEDVVKKAKKGGKFEDLAKQYSEDSTKEKGGEVGWIVQGQTLPEYERAAFSLPKGAISDLIQTKIGFYILRIEDRETARTQSLEEVRSSIEPILAAEKVNQLASDLRDKIAAAVRKSTRGSLEDLAKQFSMTVGETPAVSATDPVPALGASPELRDAIFRQRQGELGLPARTERGLVVLSVKEIRPAHTGSLAEVRDRVLADYRREKAVELARTRAEELAKKAQESGNLSAAAKALGFEIKTSESIARSGTIPEVGPARELSAAFTLAPGRTGAPASVGTNWVVYRVTSREEAKPEDLERQRKEITQRLLQERRQVAYEAFQAALRDRLQKEGQLKYNRDNMKRLAAQG